MAVQLKTVDQERHSLLAIGWIASGGQISLQGDGTIAALDHASHQLVERLKLFPAQAAEFNVIDSALSGSELFQRGSPFSGNGQRDAAAVRHIHGFVNKSEL